MSVLISKNTVYMLQGLTGKEGLRAAEWMQSAGAHIAAGVTPGKGGQRVLGIPVYNSVSDALQAHPEITVTCLYVPPTVVATAAFEAIAAGLKVLHIFAELVPTRDTVAIFERAQKHSVRVIGPSSVGIATPDSVLGSIGGGENSFLFASGDQQGVAIISKSGGMAKTMADTCTYANIPLSFVAGIGGDRIVGTTFADLLPDLIADPQTGAIVLIGEIGGTYEEDFAAALQKSRSTKPVLAYVSGLFAETLPQGVAFGHAGAIVDAKTGTRASKIAALTQAGVVVVDGPQDIVKQLPSIVQL